ncbi:MAG: GerMN domain-containing protein [Nostocaceae cyanobacterium]|nr:GerMN domain-containing protein [Nostocaceae cyanobacterium]
MNEQRTNRISNGAIAAVAAAVLLVGGGAGWYAWNSTQVPSPETPSKTTQVPSQITQEESPSIYWLTDTGTGLELVPQSLKMAATDEPNKVLTTAFERLLAGPTEGTGSTTIPQGTKLLGVKKESDGIHVNLSEEFTSGGGTASMMGRLGQVIYTATTLDPNAKVYIEVNGEELDVLGGEGLELEQPLTRKSFNEEFQL